MMMKAEWQPIKTAPKDGTMIVAATKAEWVKGWEHFPYPMQHRWNGEKWEMDDGNVYDPQPTHWMPLPSPPEPHHAE